MATKYTKSTSYAEAQPFDDAPTAPQMGSFEVVKVVREYVPIHGGGSHTIGQILDDYLVESRRAGIEVQSVDVQFSPDQWRAYAEGVLSRAQ